MSLNLKYAIEASVFWPPADRVVPGGYKASIKEEDVYKFVKKIEGVDGVELYYPYDFRDVKMTKKILDNNGLSVSAVGAGCFSEAKWQNGGVTSDDKEIRNSAIRIAKEAMEAASELGSEILVFWPAHDGYDYCLQTDYIKKWNLLVNSIRDIAKSNKKIKVGIEYKPKEPRAHQIIPNATKALKLAKDTGQENVGVIMDIGHSFLANENPAEEAAYLINENKLFHLHSNDNYSDWDYDLQPASVHFWENIELFYWLNNLNHNGWINFDICPFRIDAIKSCYLSIKHTKKIVEFVKNIASDDLHNLISSGDTLSVQEFLWDNILNK